MMLHSQNPRELDPRSFNHTCKLHNLKPPFSICSNSLRFNPSSLPSRKNRTLNKPSSQISSGSRDFLGFNLQCCSKTLILTPNSSIPIKGKKKRYGGFLNSILRALDNEEEIEKCLNLYVGKLNPKEQTVILKEQRNWERVIRVFDWMKSQDDYLPNVIHYNVVLRVLGRAQRWDDLRLCWIDMAKDGVFPTNNTYSMLVDVYGKAGLVQEALLWIKHMRVRGVFPDEVTMSTVVGVLKDAREFDRADRFYKGWCAGRIELESLELNDMGEFESGSGVKPISLKRFLSTELFKIGGRSSSSKMTVDPEMDGSIRKPRLTVTYNTLIDLYGKAGCLNDAADVFAEMLKSGVATDTITFNTMIHICGSQGNLSEAEALLSKMEDRGLNPDTKTYNTFLSLYAEAGNIDAALETYRKIKEVGLVPDVVTHRALLHVLSERKMVQEAETVMEEMEKFNIGVDERSVPVIMKMYVDEGLTERARLMFEKCRLHKGFSSKTYAAIIDAYAEKGLIEEAEAVFFGQRDFLGERKDVLEYNVMVKVYGKAKLYDKAFSLFKGMKNQGTWPDDCTYNSLIQMFATGDFLDRAKDVLMEMQEAGLKPRCQTFSSVIAGFVRLGQLSDAVDVFQDMINSEVRPNEVVYGSLINGFAEAGRISEAQECLSMMENDGIAVNQIILTSLIKAYSKGACLEEAKATYQLLKEMEGGPDTVASNSMISLYADHGVVSEAKLIFDDMREKGYADEITYATMMNMYKGVGMLDEAINIAEEMKRSGLLRDSASFTEVMACYVTKGELVKCGELLREMVNQKIFPDSNTVKVLFIILKKGSIPSEAIRVLETSYWDKKPYARQAIMTCVFSLLGLHDMALESCREFIESKVGLDTFVYNVAIYAYGRSGQIEKALNFLMKMKDDGVDPDVVTYINLVNCYGRANMIEGVKRVYAQLKYGEIEPSESLFEAIIGAYRNANRHDLADLVNREMRFFLEQNRSTESEADSEEERG